MNSFAQIHAEYEARLIHHNFVWQNIPILILQDKEICLVFDCITDENIGVDHLQIKATQPISISETGYKSYYVNHRNLAEYKTVISYVSNWLDHEAEKPAWKKYVEKSRQLTLF